MPKFYSSSWLSSRPNTIVEPDRLDFAVDAFAWQQDVDRVRIDVGIGVHVRIGIAVDIGVCIDVAVRIGVRVRVSVAT